ncbi:RNA polymerase sigma factor [Paenibacillus alkalitolerans]|uniref:RNA polymerase sigma factor n=1 Tax=Paenibacillus alkalitolerans TaxID=2799335 RepID=UPI0018F4C45B|nr:sigma-70 family RNA polymerase sigma factor [Paenibacillus alkalitolerans]
MIENNEEEVRLAALAQAGDSTAFGELVRLHRAKAFGIARKIVRDRETAEDVVQDALIQAFRHINRLADVERFAPWLSRIVRNEALMTLRRQVRQAKQSTFSDMEHKVAGSGGSDDKPQLDNILYQLSSAKSAADGFDPQQMYMRQEFLRSVHRMLHCLSAKEREVFEAHFFNELSPQEIAQVLKMTEGSVYKSISRSRQKVKDEQVREYLRETLGLTDGGKRNGKVVLPLRISEEIWKSSQTSVAVCAQIWLRHFGGTDLSISDVMGLTGQAFRLCLETETIGVSGPLMYFWEPVFSEGLANIGLLAKHIGDGGVAPSKYMLLEAVRLARNEIIAGRPVIAWDLSSPGFGLLYGFDDNRQLFTGNDGSGVRTFSYDRMGRGESGGIFILALQRINRSTVMESAVRRTVSMAMAHAYGERTFPGFACGLGAYKAWIGAFRNGSVDPLGNAYTIHVAADARLHAVRYLRGCIDRWDGERAQLAFEAEGYYYETAAIFAKLSAMFPFPSGGQPLNKCTSEEAVKLLTLASEHEEAGLHALSRLSQHLKQL